MVVTESQSFRGSWIIWVVLMLELPTLALISVFYFTGKLGENGLIHLLVVAGIMGTIIALLLNIRLEIRMDHATLSFKNPPFMNKWRILKKEDIRYIQVKKSDGMMEYGGLGVRFLGKTRAYIFFSDHVIIAETEKRKYVFSTHKSDHFQKIIASWELENSN
ncbi:MAG: hypothetical protein Q8S14_08145 [Algoriphagus sp.]|uniref:hypothetical protein n=1 Tax=Algoriphagus sp. TaxID=1872435 RepID=UPI0027320BB5|nr:hypothetical protein [Algoriphagus sp.]MDP2043446.1 hypothetical protein [Algoriphagus sp.]MDP3471831.1 hypothetical protein [Algoriphagus sp.]